MGSFVDSIRTLALALGGPGLVLVAFLDSSFLPLPGITDVLLVVMVTRNPGGMPWYVVATVAGSLAGCVNPRGVLLPGAPTLFELLPRGFRSAEDSCRELLKTQSVYPPSFAFTHGLSPDQQRHKY